MNSRAELPPELNGQYTVEFPVSGTDLEVPTKAFGTMISRVAADDPGLIVTNVDGNVASGMPNINEAMQIRHPSEDSTYNQGPEGRVYEPVSEDACAGLAAALSLFGGRSAWLTYESFAINGMPIWQTVTQAMAELPHSCPSAVLLLTAGALEQGRNGWTHQRPEIEAYLSALTKNGNVFPLFPIDANMLQAAYEWALGQTNKGIALFASKSPLPVRTTLEEGRRAIKYGAHVVHESGQSGTFDIAVAGDMVLQPVLEAAALLAAEGIGVRVVSVVNPRRFYASEQVAWEAARDGDGTFMSDEDFDALFPGSGILCVTGGASAIMEPVLDRAGTRPKACLSWQRGETTSGPGELYAMNGVSPPDIVKKVKELELRKEP